MSRRNNIKFFSLVFSLVFIGIMAVYTQSIGAATSPFDPLAQSCDSSLTNAETNPDICNEKQSDSAGKISGAVAKSLNLLSIVAGIIAVIIIIISGITLMTSSGDPAKFNEVRNTIIYTAVGVGIIILARTIVSFIVYKRLL